MPVQEFNPDNVLLSERPDGTLLGDHNNMILKDVRDQSIVAQLGKFEEMTGQEKKFQFQADGVSAYWVEEGQKIQTTKPTMVEAKMTAHKLGVIVVASREFLSYTWSEFFEEIRPQLAEAFRLKLDEAAILNVDNPFSNSLEQAVQASGNVLENAEITYGNILALEDMLYEHDEEPNAFISKKQNRTALRGASVSENGVLQTMYDRSNNEIDGIYVADLPSTNFEKGNLFAGNFDNLRYGIPFPISYKISEEGQLSTIKNADGTPVNLFEQELIAMRATMDVAVHVLKDEAFAKLQATPEV